MARTVILYAIALALAAAGLEWLKHRHAQAIMSTEIYLGLLVALVSAGLPRDPRLLPAAR